ncbi:MAG: CDP-alcohol phosphatidyltransferase family protein [Hyphomicrobiaceae bacterium]|nr:CDP-alcohol phosphatidyltransferase family protein [Hyphomicrobiaceae bacterium]
MLDGAMRRLIDPPLNRAGAALARLGVTANAVTLAGAGAALAMTAALALGALGWALGFLALSRLADGLDGAIARSAGKSGFGGYLDIVCDYVFYAGVPLGFALADPAMNGAAAAGLLAAFYVNGGTFLGYSVLAERHGLETATRGVKSLYFTGGLAEGTETIAVFVAMMLFPAAFVWIAWGFAALTAVTAASRLLLAARVFGGKA